MHQIQRAIIMAAGTGNRMQPLSFEVPKPLIEVNGTRMIDSVINALHQNNIHEIYVVAGYQKEKFDSLEEQYPGVKILENPLYDTCNNISSLYAAKDYLEDVMILDGDQLIYNPAILHRDFEKSGYACSYTDKPTSEWLLQADENNHVFSCSRTGGQDGWQLYSVSRWSKEDGEKLKACLEQEFIDNNNREIYWDDLALFCHPEQFDLGIDIILPGDLVEIDSLEELADADPKYKPWLDKKDRENREVHAA